MTIESANFGEKVTREFEQTKNEMSIQINTLTNKLMSYDIKLEQTDGHYMEHKAHFKRLEESVIECNRIVEATRQQFDYDTLVQMKDWKAGLQRKLWLFTDGIFKEFKYINERLEAKLLYEIGYHDQMVQPEPYQRIKYDDVISQGSIPSISTIKSHVHKRPNSVARFRKPKDEKALSDLNFKLEDLMEKSLNNMRVNILSDRDKGELDPDRAEELKFKELAEMQDEIRKVRMGQGR